MVFKDQETANISLEFDAVTVFRLKQASNKRKHSK